MCFKALLMLILSSGSFFKNKCNNSFAYGEILSQWIEVVKSMSLLIVFLNI